MEKDTTNSELLEVIVGGFSKVESRFQKLEREMATKEDLLSLKVELENFRLETNTHFNNLETDLKSFKKDTTNTTDKTIEDVADLTDTVMHHDKRIEKLENKFV